MARNLDKTDGRAYKALRPRHRAQACEVSFTDETKAATRPRGRPSFLPV
jgi:hypothetical protein